MKYLISFVLGAVISLILGPIIIPFLKSMNAGQSIREDGPESHLTKAGTPTIGGLIFLSSFLIANIVMTNFSVDFLIVLFATLAFGAVGFIDDYIKVVKKRNLGLTAIQKLLLQILFCLVVLYFQYNSKELSTEVYVPFIKKMVSFNYFYIPFIIFVIVGVVNSVNLTDGLDGLSSGVTTIVLLFFAAVAIRFERYSIAIASFILAGALVGFLKFNKFPAKVFMGDTGSLALGGAVSSIAVLLNIPLLLPIACGVYFIETLSVILQVLSYKIRGKRIFLMSPLHHHFEQKGWKETKVVKVFYLAQLILCIIGYLLVI